MARRVRIDLSVSFFPSEEARKHVRGGRRFAFSECFLFQHPFSLLYLFLIYVFSISLYILIFYLPFSLPFSICMFAPFPYYPSLLFLLLVFIFLLSFSCLFLTYPCFPSDCPSLFSSAFLFYLFLFPLPFSFLPSIT